MDQQEIKESVEVMEFLEKKETMEKMVPLVKPVPLETLADLDVKELLATRESKDPLAQLEMGELEDHQELRVMPARKEIREILDQLERLEQKEPQGLPDHLDSVGNAVLMAQLAVWEILVLMVLKVSSV